MDSRNENDTTGSLKGGDTALSEAETLVSEAETKTLVRAVPGARPDTLQSNTGVAAEALAPTLAHESSSEPKVVDASPVSFDASRRYDDRKLLGAGGMGEVRLCADAFVGRDVAMKIMRKGPGSTGSARARFLREARVQGQLEHPSIVPVYDIGREPNGNAFFTMKRVKGHTFEEIIVGLREEVSQITEKYSRRKLLSALSQVCLALELSHRRGVVHRDLKPANIMLGDYGEVYVLDWGVAKILGEADLSLNEADAAEAAVDQTAVGSLVGTPGYMAPEQAMGDIDAIGPASDVYSLGVILFELLTLQPLITGRTVQDLLVQTMRGVDSSPQSRAPELDIAPELDAICVRACAVAWEDRYASARELHDAIEAVLDGEQDAEKREQLSQQHVDRAHEILGAELVPEDAQARAMQELTRAIALNPGNRDALRVLTEWVTSSTRELPPEAEAALKEVEGKDRARSAKRMGYGFLSWFLLSPLFLWLGVRSWGCALATEAAVLLVAGYGIWMGKTGRAGPEYMRWGIALTFVVVGTASFMLGPLILTPAIAGTAAAALVINIRANTLTRRYILISALTSVFFPLGLQLSGLMPASYAVENGQIVLMPVAMNLPPTGALIFLSAATVLQLILTVLLIGGGVDQLVRAERKNFGQAWRLKRLLPQ